MMYQYGKCFSGEVCLFKYVYFTFQMIQLNITQHLPKRMLHTRNAEMTFKFTKRITDLIE